MIKSIDLSPVCALLLGLSFFGLGMAAHAEEQLSTEEKQDLEAKSEIIKKITTTKGTISSRYSTLERMRDRQGRLVNEMKNDTKIGCRQNDSINVLELRIEGAHADKRYLGKSKHKRPTTGKPSLIEVQLGDSFSFSFDEKTQSVFQTTPTGSIIRTEFSDLQIKDIEFIKIRKGGAGYSHEQQCKTKSSFFGFSKKTSCKFLIHETERYQINSIELLVNEETVYRSGGGDNFVLEKGDDGQNKLTFEKRDINLNKEYQLLMAKDDCE